MMKVVVLVVVKVVVEVMICPSTYSRAVGSVMLLSAFDSSFEHAVAGGQVVHS